MIPSPYKDNPLGRIMRIFDALPRDVRDIMNYGNLPYDIIQKMYPSAYTIDHISNMIRRAYNQQLGEQNVNRE